MKDIENTATKWKDIPWSEIGRINSVNMSILPKVIHRLSWNSIKIPMTFFFSQIRANNPKLYTELQNTSNGQSNLVNDEQSLKYRAPWLQSVKKATVIKTEWYRNKNKCRDQWNRIDNPEINPPHCGQSMTKEARICKIHGVYIHICI